jgi:putative MATE family efflux protein
MWVRACGAEGAAAEMAAAYLGTIYLVQPAISFKPVVDAAFIGMGNTMIPMALALLAVALNFVSAPLLIYGVGDWEGLGIAGAAWSTGFSRLIAVVAGAHLLRRWFELPLERRRLDWTEVRAQLRIGAPMAMSAIGYAVVFLVVLKTTVQELGRDVQAGLGVGFNGVESLAYCALMGPAVAASSIVGRRLAAGDPAGARAGMRACMAMSVGIGGAATIAFLAWPELLAGAFAAEAGVRAEAATYLRVVAFSQIVTAADAVMQQSMAGAGRTLRMAVLNLGCYAVRIPLAAALVAAGAGAAGVWWALNGSNYLKLGAMILLFRRLRLFATPPAA